MMIIGNTNDCNNSIKVWLSDLAKHEKDINSVAVYALFGACKGNFVLNTKLATPFELEIKITPCGVITIFLFLILL